MASAEISVNERSGHEPLYNCAACRGKLNRLFQEMVERDGEFGKWQL